MRIFLYCCAWMAFLWGNFEENIIQTFKDDMVEVKVVAQERLNDGLHLVLIEQKNGTQILVFATSDGKNIMGVSEPLIFTNQKYQEILKKHYQNAINHNKQQSDKKILEHFDQNAWISLRGKAKHGKIYLILDPNCIYCKQEVSKISSFLKDYQEVHLMFCGLLGIDSLHKAASIYEDLKGKNQKEMLDVIQKAFAKDYKALEGIKTDAVRKLTIELMELGVNGVPYIIKQ